MMVNFIIGSTTPTDCEFLTADITGDGEVNILDVVSLVNVIMGAANAGPCDDITGDGEVNILDVILIVNNVLDGNYNFHSDLNQDHFLNIQDIILLIGNILEN